MSKNSAFGSKLPKMAKEVNKEVGKSSLSLSFVDDLNPAKDMWNMKVRIIRKWSLSFRIETILLDEKGCKIQAGIKSHLMVVFDSQLQEDDVVILSKFGVGENKDPFKVVDHVYKINFYLCYSTYFQQRAILAPTNEVVDSINKELSNMLPGEEKIYLSSESLCETKEQTDINMALFPPDVLNNLHLSGLPNHKLVLKVGAPVMLFRNIDQANGLCNDTRLQVTKLGKLVIEAKIITSNNIGHHTLISRLKMIPSDKRIPVKIARRQFPLSLCFAMTINKSQGQSLERVGLYLPRPIFSHGQLYVVVSRVKSSKGLKILICNKEKEVCKTTTNVVYKEVLQNL